MRRHKPSEGTAGVPVHTAPRARSTSEACPRWAAHASQVCSTDPSQRLSGPASHGQEGAPQLHMGPNVWGHPAPVDLGGICPGGLKCPSPVLKGKAVDPSVCLRREQWDMGPMPHHTIHLCPGVPAAPSRS